MDPLLIGLKFNTNPQLNNNNSILYIKGVKPSRDFSHYFEAPQTEVCIPCFCFVFFFFSSFVETFFFNLHFLRFFSLFYPLHFACCLHAAGRRFDCRHMVVGRFLPSPARMSKERQWSLKNHIRERKKEMC